MQVSTKRPPHLAIHTRPVRTAARRGLQTPQGRRLRLGAGAQRITCCVPGSLLAACWWLVFHSWIDLTGCRFEAGLHAMSNTRAWQEQTRNLSGSDLPGYSLRDLGKRMRRIPAFWQVICFVLENREMYTFRLSRLYETWHTYATAWLKRCLCSSSFQSASWSQMQQTRDSYFAPHLFPHFPPFPSPSILQHGTDGCSVGGGPGCFACDNCSLCGTACEVRPTCWEPRPSKFWRFFYMQKPHC